MTDERNPWRRLSREVVYEVPWFRLYRDQVVNPVGRKAIYSVIEPRLAVGVVALSANNEVYLVGQYRYPTDCYSWEIIEGGAEPGESALATGQRELMEEAGLSAEHWIPLGGEVHTSNCFTSERAVIYRAYGITEVSAQPDESEVLTLRRVPLVDIPQMLSSGAITDAISIIALYRLMQSADGAF